MKIVVTLPIERRDPGMITDGIDTWRCLGKADNAAATLHGNPTRDPTRPYGDHPDGVSRVGVRQSTPAEAHSYGPWKLTLSAVSGDVKTREDCEPGWDGLEVHGGELTPGGALRPTYGCLRVDNDAIAALATRALAALQAGESVDCECVTV